jgi:PKD repeat protein
LKKIRYGLVMITLFFAAFFLQTGMLWSMNDLLKTDESLPVANFLPSETETCAPAIINFTNTSTGATTWEWDFGNNLISNAFEPQGIIFTNSGTDPKTYNISLTATNESGSQNTYSLPITVLPGLIAGFNISESTICASNGVAKITISNNSHQAIQTFWTIFNEQDTVVFENNDLQFDHVFENHSKQEMVYTVQQKVVNNWGCEAQTSRQLTIFPGVRAAIAPVESGCHPLTLNFASQTELADTWRWEFSDGSTSFEENPQKTFFNQTHTSIVGYNARLIAETINGCTHDTIIYFIVHPSPKASFSLPQAQGCSPFSTTILDLSEVTGESNYQWSFTPGIDSIAAAGDLEYTFTNPGVASQQFDIGLTVKNEFGCSAFQQQTITIFPEVKAMFSLSENNGCTPMEVTINNLSEGADGNIPYLWDYGNGISYNNQLQHSRMFANNSHTQPKDFSIILQATSAFGCTDTSTQNLQIFPRPKAKYTLPATEVCSPAILDFTDQSLGEGLNYSWFSAGEMVSAEPGSITQTYLIAASAEPIQLTTALKLVNEFGCSDSIAQNITIFPEVKAEFTSIKEGCGPLDVTFENNSLGATQWLWQLGTENQSFQQQPLHTFINPTYDQVAEFPVSLTATSSWGCENTASDTIRVWPSPLIAFAMDETSGCSPLEINFTNQSQGTDQYSWKFGNETSETAEQDFWRSFENNTAIPDTLAISLNGLNNWGCESQANRNIIVFPKVSAEFSSTTEKFEGCSPLALTFNNQSSHANLFNWKLGDNIISESKDLQYTFTSQQNQHTEYSLYLEAISDFGCMDVAERNIKAFAQPVALFEATPKEQFFPDRTVSIINNTEPGQWAYSWELGDGYSFETSESASFEYTYEWNEGQQTTQDYLIRLRVSNEYCQNVIQQEISIKAEGPIAAFESDIMGCPPFEVEFENKSYFGNLYEWDFGDGNASVEMHPVHTFSLPGKYDVSLTVSGNTGTRQTSKTITVFQPPVANFRIESDTINLPDDWAQMTNLSAQAYTFAWEFGDGNFSDEESPTHYYTEPGNYTVELMVGNNTDPQCFDQVSKEITAIINQEEIRCQLNFPNAFTPSQTGPGDGSYQMGDPANTVFHPRHNGIENYSLEIFNRWGEKIFESNDILTGWDGYIRSELAPMGVYVFNASATCTNGKELHKKGDLTLLR